ncbi:MAG TPA: DUF3889 domain-containing protein [Paenibacillus sp.]|nr:DUF3889 domain-containing protein [Paenibacillus sp.]
MNGFAAAIVPLLATLLFAPPPQAAEPRPCSASFADWLDDAVRAAGSTYPHATLQDILYVGCKPITGTDKAYIYKLWMREGARRFGAYAAITVDPATGRRIGAAVEPTDSSGPAYEKWRLLAEQTVLAAFPGAKTVDLRPCLCEASPDGTGLQTFKFWIEGGGASRLLDVSIRYCTDDEQVISTDIHTIRTW